MRIKRINYYGIVIGCLVVLTGLLILSLPFISDYILVKQQETAIESILKNNHIEKNSVDVGKAVLGAPLAVLNVPSIDLTVPIYEGTTETVLQKGIGHLEGSSDVLGGSGKHAVLSGHRGLSIAKLFTDLPDVKKGDSFTIEDKNGKRQYQVDLIQEVDAQDLSINSSKYFEVTKSGDYVTLFTCTPLYVNSHRWLVRGSRVPLEQKKAIERATFSKKIIYSLVVAGTASFSLFAVFLLKKKKGRTLFIKVYRPKKAGLVFLTCYFLFSSLIVITTILSIIQGISSLNDPLELIVSIAVDEKTWLLAFGQTFFLMSFCQFITCQKQKKNQKKGLRNV